MSIVAAPRINTNDDQVGVVLWHVEDGDYIEVGDDLVDLETSKAVVTIAAEVAGYVRRISPKGAIVRVGAPICDVSETASDTTPLLAGETPESTAASTASSTRPADSGPAATNAVFAANRFSPGAAALIDSLNMDPGAFEGAGLVTAKMVRERQDPGLKRRRTTQAVNPASAAQQTALTPLPITSRDEPTSLAKRAEISMLTTGESGLINSTLSVYFDSAAVRERLAQGGYFDGSIQPIILYELSRLLRQWPQFTAYFDANVVHYYERVDLGVAIDMGRGLKVVTIKDADLLMPTDIHERTIEFGLRYLENRIQPHELVGSTITVTDLSGLDVLHFKPLINGHQSTILGIGGDSERPGHPMSFNLTFDHRVTNGREAATFLKELRERVLSYAPPRPMDPPTAHLAQQAAPARLMTPPSCAKCGIDRATYFSTFSDPYWFAGFSEDGELEAYCHRCAGGFA